MDLKEIRQLIRFLESTDVTEFELSEETQKIRIARGPAVVAPPAVSHGSSYPSYIPPPPPPVSHSILGGTATPAEVPPPNAVAIKSPMVGIFYRSSKPESPAFVQVGDVVSKGQALCIVEAMKLMNEIEADVAGRVVRILKENASPVEYGEDLFYIEPV